MINKIMIIIINGAPSAGKSSTIKEMQKLYDKPLLHIGIDRFWAMIPDQYKEFGAKATEGYSFTQTTDQNNNPIVEVKSGPFAQQIDYTMAQVVKCIADCGHDVAVDEIITEKISLDRYVKALENHNVYFIGIVCDLEELEKREQLRGNRLIGLARGHIDSVHQYKDYYDLIIDSTHCSPATCAQNILDFIQRTPHPQGFKK